MGVPPQLEADGRNWATFQFRVENHLELIHRGARGAPAWAVEQENEITTVDRDDDLLLAVSQLQAGDDLDEELYGSLSALLCGEPADILMSVGRGAGLEGWRRLARRYDGAGRARLHGTLTVLLIPERRPPKELSSYILQW